VVGDVVSWHPTAGRSTAPARSAHPPAGERELFLDAVRAIALARVVLWHTTGAVALTYLVAAVPAMFFVTGSLLAKSLRRSARAVIADRARRILVPLWVFAAVAWSAMGIAALVSPGERTALRWSALVWWIVPLRDPVGSAWEGGYLASPLWYLRALLWLLLLAPALLWLVRRAGLVAAALPVAVLVALEIATRRGALTVAGTWKTGDLALYGTFVMLGFAHRDGLLDAMTARRWLAAALAGAAAATTWCLVAPPPGGVVNDSHIAHLLVGATWLALLLALRSPIERVAARPRVHGLIRAISRRTMTIYLWHPAAAVVALAALRPVAAGWPNWLLLVVLVTATVCGTTLAAYVVGPVEDRANRRPAEPWPSERPARGWRRIVPGPASLLAAAGAGMALATFATLVLPAGDTAAGASGASAASTFRLRVPSRQPDAATTDPGVALGAAELISQVSPAVTGAGPDVDDPFTALIRRTVDEWAAASGVPGVSLAIEAPGLRVQYATGRDVVTGTAMSVDDEVDIASITKTFTATLVWQMVDRGALDPDAPLPRLAAAPEIDTTRFTARQLLSHTSGLVNYRDTAAYAHHPAQVVDAVSALRLVAAGPLRFAPGTAIAYSSSNYLVLGLLLEQLDGRSFDAQLAPLLTAAGLDGARHAASSPGEPQFSTAGLELTMSELARWGVALLDDGVAGLSPVARREMAASDTTALGAGLWGYCPCTALADGTIGFAAFGHSGSNTQLRFYPASHVSIALALGDSVWEPGERPAAINVLATALEQLVANRAAG
jgi:CubicO group peptidase (beta-lactamase class C family)/peptidoglycan/LPS O-acetylase OafA/YrhL